MAEYRDQHYLPAVYLRNFSVDGRSANRRSQIWRIDPTCQRLVPTDSQGRERDFYSRTRGPQIEPLFKQGEDFYAKLSPRLWSETVLKTPRDSFGLLVMMLDLHIRNLAYGKSERENFDEYLAMATSTKRYLLWSRSDKPPDDQAIVDEAQRNWGVRILRPASGSEVLTSDNPSMWFKLGGSRSLANLVMTPLTPYAYGVAFDQRELEVIAQTLSVADERDLTRCLIRNCVRCAFASRQLTDQEWHGFKSIFAGRRGRPPPEGPGKWGVDLFSPAGNKVFDFVRQRRPRESQPAA